MIKLGFVSAILPDQSFEQVFQLAHRIGFDCVEVCCWPAGKAERRYAGITHIDVASLSKTLVRQISEIIDSTGVEISGLGYYPNPLTPDEDEASAATTHIKAVIDAAARLGIHKMNTFVGRDWKLSVDDNWKRFRKTWKPLIRHAEKRGVKVGIENCPMSFTADEWPGGKNLATTPAIWDRMFEDIPSDFFGLNYDPSHMVWQHMDYLAPLRDYTDKLFHVHAKDVRMDKHRLDRVGIMAHPLEYHSPKLPGLGEVNWGKFFSVLTEVGYQGPICVEVEDRAYEGSLENRIASLVQSHTYLRQFVPKPLNAEEA